MNKKAKFIRFLIAKKEHIFINANRQFILVIFKLLKFTLFFKERTTNVKIFKKNFKTIIISQKKLNLAFKILSAILGVLSILAILKFGNISSQRLAISDSFYKTVISAQLHNEKNFSAEEFLKKLFFDISDTKSILGKYNPMLSQDLVPSPTPAPTPIQPLHPASSPAPVLESSVSGGMKLSNLTNIKIDPESLANEELSFSVSDTKLPQILIFHTHTTESFTDSDTNKYISTSSDRSLEEEKNIVAVGKAMKEVFEKNGIITLHDTTVHDYPSYNGAYTRSLATVRNNLEANPQIKLVLDVHRDGIVKEDGTKVKVVCDIEGEKTAQCMFVIGSNALLSHDNWLENMKLACKIQKKANQMYPDLMRPIILREERFNQQTSIGSIIIEVGSNGNTLEEAIRGGVRIAEAISSLFGKT